jgi:TFIIF-interacting CTD phosphatases, including NLI-interacting factor
VSVLTSQSDKLLILDLDETLVFATESPLDRDPDFIALDYSVYRRPHVDQFLRFCVLHFRVAVWTSSGSQYAAAVVNNLFGSAERLEFLWCADRCTLQFDADTGRTHNVKRLSKLKRLGYDLTQVIVVDDTERKHRQNYGNLVRVREYVGDPNDNELHCLERYLVQLKDVPNVRNVEKRWWHRQVGCE